MLVLSRKRLEKIWIGDDIVITVLEIRADRVRLGITAPRELDVHREEVWAAIQAQHEAPETGENSDGDR